MRPRRTNLGRHRTQRPTLGIQSIQIRDRQHRTTRPQLRLNHEQLPQCQHPDILRGHGHRVPVRRNTASTKREGASRSVPIHIYPATLRTVQRHDRIRKPTRSRPSPLPLVIREHKLHRVPTRLVATVGLDLAIHIGHDLGVLQEPRRNGLVERPHATQMQIPLHT